MAGYNTCPRRETYFIHEMTATIKFGTSGWRAIIAEDFTFANVRLATAAIAEHVRSRNAHATLIVGHDTRFFAEEFTRTAAEILREHGIHVLLCDGPTPTPVIAHEILRRKIDGAINFTASHNPAEYQGLKFSGPTAARRFPKSRTTSKRALSKLASAPPQNRTTNHLRKSIPANSISIAWRSS